MFLTRGQFTRRKCAFLRFCSFVISYTGIVVVLGLLTYNATWCGTEGSYARLSRALRTYCGPRIILLTKNGKLPCSTRRFIVASDLDSGRQGRSARQCLSIIAPQRLCPSGFHEACHALREISASGSPQALPNQRTHRDARSDSIELILRQ